MAELPDFRPKGKQPSGGVSLPDFRPGAKKQLAGSDPSLAPREGESEEAYANRLVYGDPKPLPDAGKGDAFIRGTGDALWFGAMDEVLGGVGYLTGEGYEKVRDEIRAQQNAAEENHPGAYLTGEIAGSLAPIALTAGAAAPATATGRLATNVGAGALQGGIYGFNSADGDMSDRAGEAGSGALWGVGLGLVPGAAEGIYKGGRAIARSTVKNVQKVTNPRVAAEKDIVERILSDRRARQRLEARAARRGEEPVDRRFLTADDVSAANTAEQNVMVSDLGGDTLRGRLKAVSNASPEADTLMRGAAAQRQVNQGQRVSNVVADTFGDVNPKSIRDRLGEIAKEEKDAAYARAEGNPNSQHLWTPALQRAISTDAGKRAVKKAITASRDDALGSGEEIIEPIFEEGADGLMSWSGRFRRPTGELVDGIEGMGIGLRFWDHVKKSLDDEINGLLGQGAKEEARRVIRIKNQMLGNIDQLVPEYAAARRTARDFFGIEDAHEAGADYFRRMNSFDAAETRAALEDMTDAERQLFARGYAAELVNNISNMGRAEDVNKLFKSDEARRKMRDALGDDVATQLEAFTHREMVQGLLGKELAGGSSTMKQLLLNEGLKAGAVGGLGALYTGDPMTVIYGGLATAALRGGYKGTRRMIIERYAREMAELATSENPEDIQRILMKVSRDPGFMQFSRAAANGLGGAGRAAGGARVEPRLPFAGGGIVKKAAEKLAEFAAEEVAPQIAKPRGWTPGRSTVAHPVRKAFPGIYKDPRELLADVRVEPEDPALKRLFGVTRDDLYEMSKRKGNVSDILGIKDKAARGSDATDNIKTPRNARRLVSALEAARTNEGLWKGMHGWYTMDPAYQQLVRDYGPEEAARLFRRFNTLTGMSSPGSEVMTELQRGTAANMMDNLGLWDEFLVMGGDSKNARGHNFPKQLKGVDGHPYHSTSQAPAMDNYLKTGKVEMGSAKVPTYIGASTPPELGNFTDLPIADAHFTRAVGLPDTRTAEKVYDHSMTMGEYKSVAPWYRDEVASQAGLEGVPAQAIHWGLFGPQTGVTTPVGAPKLELLARGIMETARRLGISPEKARDLVLTGKAHAFEQGGLVSALGAAA